jgi:2-C-methyl-D-erythritol 4-phosphate cytidylyltransferase
LFRQFDTLTSGALLQMMVVFHQERAMSVFSVLILTAAPPGLSSEAAGAYIKVDGRECLLRSVEMFLNRDNIKQIQLVVTPEAAEEAKRKYGGHLGFSGVKLLVAGPRWVDQIAAAAEKISAECTHVIVHDAARPAVAYSDIDAVMGESGKHAAVALVAPLRGALVETDEGGNPLAVHLPDHYVQLLTPQSFAKAKFVELAKAKKEIHASELYLIKGSPLNIRVASGQDASIAKAMINLLPKPKMKVSENPFEEAQW